MLERSSLSPGQQARPSSGRSPAAPTRIHGQCGFRQTGDLGASTGAGGIYSTVEDLQAWVQNFASPRVGSAEIFDDMMTSYVLTDGENMRNNAKMREFVQSLAEQRLAHGSALPDRERLRRFMTDLSHTLFPPFGSSGEAANHDRFSDRGGYQCANSILYGSWRSKTGIWGTC